MFERLGILEFLRPCNFSDDDKVRWIVSQEIPPSCISTCNKLPVTTLPIMNWFGWCHGGIAHPRMIHDTIRTTHLRIRICEFCTSFVNTMCCGQSTDILPTVDRIAWRTFNNFLSTRGGGIVYVLPTKNAFAHRHCIYIMYLNNMQVNFSLHLSFTSNHDDIGFYTIRSVSIEYYSVNVP